MKRTFDIIVSSSGLVLLSPLMAAVGLIIILTSGSPALFFHVRVGRNGKKFWLWKFRTMKIKAGTEDRAFEPGTRERVTSFGRILRAFKLDELPQLWNVLKGDMSIVGPRPEVPIWVDVFPERWKYVLSIRPGITDPASLIFRDEESILACSINPLLTYRDMILPEKLRIYEAYVTKHTITRDIRIVLETIGKIICDNLNRDW